MPTLGSRIAALREARGLTQHQLARLIGVSQPSLSNIEADKTKKLRGDTLAGLCRALAVHPDALLRDSPEPETQEAILFESELLSIWRRLTADDRGHLMAVARGFEARMTAKPASQKPAQTTHKPSVKHRA